MSEVESQVVPTTTAPVTEAPVTSAAPAPTATPDPVVATTEGTETPTYTPDYKFNAYGEDGEVPEGFRQYIKDKATEDSFKELARKAHSFEKAHEKLERVRNEYQPARQELEEYKTGLNELRGYVQHKDFDSFFKRLNVPMAAVWEWVNDKVNYQELSPEQKIRYDESMRLKRENLELENRYKSTGETSHQLMNRLANMELDMALTKPDVREFQEAYDAKRGRKGAFRDFVIDRGAAIEARTRKDCDAADAIKDALEWLNYDSTQGSTTTQPLMANSSHKPVIPNIKGGGVAPVKKRPQNLKELRAEIERRQQANS